MGAGAGDAGDTNALNVTAHHDGWPERVHVRLPRVRVGEVRVLDDHDSSSENVCSQA